MNITGSVFTFYRYPSVQITYFLAALLLLELFFLAFHTYHQAKKSSILSRGAAVSQVIYFCIYTISILCTYIQNDDAIISDTVFAMEFIVIINDILFTTLRSALFTRNKVIMKRKYHKILLGYNIFSLIEIPSLVVFYYFYFNFRYSVTGTFATAGIIILSILVNQITNIIVFLYLTYNLSKADVKQHNKLRRMRIYTVNLVLAGIVSKLYLAAINVIEGDFIFVWSQTIIDGNLLCIYFILSSWHKLMKTIKKATKSVDSSSTENYSVAEGKHTSNHRMKGEVTLDMLEVELKEEKKNLNK